MRKLFTAVLNERLTQFLEDNELLKPNQAGFRKFHATTYHIFALHALIELLKYEKKKLFCCFVDFSKAFDSVWRAGLWSKLLKNDIYGNFLRIPKNMYLNIKSCVSAEGNDSPFFFSNRGVRQGDNISPVLFSLFLDDLEDYFLTESTEGIPVECMTENLYFYMQIYVLLYADDTVIMSQSPEDLQNNLNIFAKYCSDWKLDVNKSKTKLVIFGARRNSTFAFNFDNSPLEIVDNYKYLGLILSKSRSFLNARKHLLEQAKKAMHLLRIRIKDLYLPVDLQLKLFHQTILPIDLNIPVRSFWF